MEGCTSAASTGDSCASISAVPVANAAPALSIADTTCGAVVPEPSTNVDEYVCLGAGVGAGHRGHEKGRAVGRVPGSDGSCTTRDSRLATHDARQPLAYLTSIHVLGRNLREDTSLSEPGRPSKRRTHLTQSAKAQARRQHVKCSLVVPHKLLLSSHFRNSPLLSLPEKSLHLVISTTNSRSASPLAPSCSPSVVPF